MEAGEDLMNTQSSSTSYGQANTSRFLLALTLGTWLVAVAGSIWFWFSPSNDLTGLEWLGSPFLGLGILALITTAYSLAARNLALRATTHAVAWLLILFLATTVNMLTLARFIFGAWKSFQVVPVVIAFELVLIALGVHFSLKQESRDFMSKLMTWTIVMFLVVVTSMPALGIGFQPGYWTIGFMAELGLGVLAGSLVIAYSALRTRPGSRRGALTGLVWRLCILITVSLLAAYFVLSAQVNVWPVSYAAVALILTVAVVALRMPSGQRTSTALPG
jgi:hypothetical protein